MRNTHFVDDEVELIMDLVDDVELVPLDDTPRWQAPVRRATVPVNRGPVELPAEEFSAWG